MRQVRPLRSFWWCSQSPRPKSPMTPSSSRSRRSLSPQRRRLAPSTSSRRRKALRKRSSPFTLSRSRSSFCKPVCTASRLRAKASSASAEACVSSRAGRLFLFISSGRGSRCNKSRCTLFASRKFSSACDTTMRAPRSSPSKAATLETWAPMASAMSRTKLSLETTCVAPSPRGRLWAATFSISASAVYRASVKTTSTLGWSAGKDSRSRPSKTTTAPS
mmetsp:Transcript_28371/g.86921  ORF Transcript_28371/g.86921 Transcript_28371/m.86921 type:complete len:219 (-) Transcript_28371:511-1167(-)